MFIGVLLALVVLAGGAAAGPVSEAVATGIITAVWVDWPDGRAEPPRFYLNGADGSLTELLPGAVPAWELERMIGQQVLAGGPAMETAAGGGEMNRLVVSSLAPLGGDKSVATDPETVGNSRWLALGCKFPDVAAVPHDMAYYAGMYRNTYPGLDHYWREVSYGQMDLAGSQAAGWFTLPKNQAAYYDGGLKWWDIVNDCTAAADAAVTFTDYDGLSFILNDTLGGSALGGPIIWDLDGARQIYAANWIPAWASSTLSIFQHEMGHGYRFSHSASATGEEYADVWDVMGKDRAGCAANDPLYGCVGKYPIAYHRGNATAWLDGRIYDAGPGTHTITLAPATRPSDPGYQMIRVPIDPAPYHYLTIEARQKESYDAGLPGNAVILHEIAERAVKAWIISPCPPQEGVICDGDSEGAMLCVGETLALALGNVAVRVDAAEGNGYRLTIVNNAPSHHVELPPVADTYVRKDKPGTNFGTQAQLLTGPNGTVSSYLNFGVLPEAITSAQLKLTAIGNVHADGETVSGASRFYKGTTTPWTETGLTYNNAPDSNQSGWGWPFPELSANTVTWELWWTQFWTTPYQTLEVGNGWQGIPVIAYSSREGANPPRLILDYLEIPPYDPPTDTHTFTPTNDATANQAMPNAIYGTKLVLQVKDAAKDMNSYLKFNAQGLTGTVQSATLRLFVKDPGPDGGKVYAASPFYKNTTTFWLETGLKWNNAPPQAGAPLDSVGKAVKGQWVELDVTAAVVAALNDNGRVSLLLTNDSTNLVTYSSKEGAKPPELVVVTSDE